MPLIHPFLQSVGGASSSPPHYAQCIPSHSPRQQDCGGPRISVASITRCLSGAPGPPRQHCPPQALASELTILSLVPKQFLPRECNFWVSCRETGTSAWLLFSWWISTAPSLLSLPLHVKQDCGSLRTGLGLTCRASLRAPSCFINTWWLLICCLMQFHDIVMQWFGHSFNNYSLGACSVPATDLDQRSVCKVQPQGQIQSNTHFCIAHGWECFMLIFYICKWFLKQTKGDYFITCKKIFWDWISLYCLGDM